MNPETEIKFNGQGEPLNQFGNVMQMPAPKLNERARLVALRQPTNPAEAQRLQRTLQALEQAAAADEHDVVSPTHVMVRGDQIIGYLSLGGLPVVQAWFDSKSGHVLDSLKMIEMGEAIFDSQGVKQYCVGVADNSPFAPHMERLGFKKLLTNTLWVKHL